MQITNQMIPAIEKALGFKLYPEQKEYLLAPQPFTDEQIKFLEVVLNGPLLPYQIEYLKSGPIYKKYGRNSGATTAYCIRLALSEGPSMDMDRPELYCDRIGLDSYITYGRGFFRDYYIHIRKKLHDEGFKVRPMHRRNKNIPYNEGLI